VGVAACTREKAVARGIAKGIKRRWQGRSVFIVIPLDTTLEAAYLLSIYCRSMK
jgi:hypothetical protein